MHQILFQMRKFLLKPKGHGRGSTFTDRILFLEKSSGWAWKQTLKMTRPKVRTEMSLQMCTKCIPFSENESTQQKSSLIYSWGKKRARAEPPEADVLATPLLDGHHLSVALHGGWFLLRGWQLRTLHAMNCHLYFVYAQQLDNKSFCRALYSFHPPYTA